MTSKERFCRLEKMQSAGYYPERIASEILYLYRIAECKEGLDSTVIDNVTDQLLKTEDSEGCIGKASVLWAEEALKEFGDISKSYKVHCVAHAHIDMNWMWGYGETTATTLETLRTVLRLMREYPDFTFSQSQASVYRIVEKFAPDMLAEIKQRVKEGRFEISASTWTECDKNMSSCESLCRHILYTKRYLSKLFDIDMETLRLDFEPDTFGHSVNLPEILLSGGVDRYYHCRGCDYRYAYRWQAPSGKEVLVYQDPKWYTGEMEAKGLAEIPIFCRDICSDGLSFYLKVYGVGDHGGGPTRRDIEKLLDMQRWPLFPTLVFSSYKAFFDELEQFRSLLPVVTGELNAVFTGCYTTQSRIKMANRLAEARLYDAEMLSVAATALTNAPSTSESFKKAWENVLFSQFHDILPGSGTVETREYCLGAFQDTLSYANINAGNAMRRIAESIDSSDIALMYDRFSVSEGGGAGHRIGEEGGFRFSGEETGNGKVRIFHLFNPSEYPRTEETELSLFDYPEPLSDLEMVNENGEPLSFRFTETNRSFWGHSVNTVAVMASLPAFGYATYVLRPKAETHTPPPGFYVNNYARQDHMSDAPIVLKNSKMTATFDHATLALISLKDASGKEWLNPDKPAGMLYYGEENNLYGMSAWRVGAMMKQVAINEAENVRILECNFPENKIRYEIKYKSSTVKVTVTLPKESEILKFTVSGIWLEVGSKDTFVPQLSFSLPVGYPCNAYRYDVPGGTLIRNPIAHDVPALSYIEMLPENKDADRHLMLMTDSKYGYRGYDQKGSVTLLRSAFSPDPLPEAGNFSVRIGIALTTSEDARRLSHCFNHPLPFITGLSHRGNLQKSGSFFSLSGKGLTVVSMKHGEERGLVIRLAETAGNSGIGTVSLPQCIKKAALADTSENIKQALSPCDSSVSFPYQPYALITLLIE